MERFLDQKIVERALGKAGQRQLHISLKIWNFFWSHNNTKIIKITNKKVDIRLQCDKRRRVCGDTTLSKSPESQQAPLHLSATWRLARHTFMSKYLR